MTVVWHFAIDSCVGVILFVKSSVIKRKQSMYFTFMIANTNVACNKYVMFWAARYATRTSRLSHCDDEHGYGLSLSN